MASEFIEELDRIFCELSYRADSGSVLTRDEQVVADIYSAIGHIEGDGIHQFWDGTENGDRVLESFRKLGASAVADQLDSIRWASGREVDARGHYLFTTEEVAQLDKAETRVYSLFQGLPTKLLAFCKERDIS